ncbi:MAG: UbiD family decarboxylase [Phycisphaeraceae bacterium]|nr:UbiD family decarboxylase [Phycisphaerales bacterium]MCB9860839.1 UbiD family decarboxylase [Phycisphaeraceae bacterium]
MDRTLRGFVEKLDRSGELVRIKAEVDPVLEISAIADRISKQPAPSLPASSTQRIDPNHAHLGGPALLFENVKGSSWPVLINALGSYRRVEMAMQCEADGIESIAHTIGSLVKPQLPRSFGEAIEKLKQFAPLAKIGPKTQSRGICNEVVLTGSQIDLTQLPFIRCWPLDGDFVAFGYPADVNAHIPELSTGDAWNERFRGRYITFAGIHTIHADDRDDPKPASHNIGMYRVQLLSPRHMAMHWHVHHDGAAHWRSWKKLGKPMPVAIALGGEPILPYAATAPLPPGISELLMAGFLNRKGIPLVSCKTVPLRVPANAEIIIEGIVSHEAGPIGWDPNTTDEPFGNGAVFEGPFGDHTGFYSMPDRYPVLTVTAITHRKNPIYPTTVVGMPPQEDYFLGKATERLFLPLLKVIVPDIEDYDLPMFGAFHNCVFVKIKKQYAFHARRVMHAIWGAGQMAWTKSIFVVDEDVDVHDHIAVLKACAANCHPVADIETVVGPVDILDHAAPVIGAGTKIGFDCTHPWQDERALSGISSPHTPRIFAAGDQREHSLHTITQMQGVSSASSPESLHGWLFISTSQASADEIRNVAHRVTDPSLWGNHPPAFAVIVSDAGICKDTDRALFEWVANSDMQRDRIITHHDTSEHSCVVFDATRKSEGTRNGLPVRHWPTQVCFDKATHELLDRRWSEYGLNQ